MTKVKRFSSREFFELETKLKVLIFQPAIHLVSSVTSVARLFYQYLAIYDNENLPYNLKIGKSMFQFCQMLNKP